LLLLLHLPLHLLLPFPSHTDCHSERAQRVEEPAVVLAFALVLVFVLAFVFPKPKLTVILSDRSGAQGVEGPAVVLAFAHAVALAFAFALPIFERKQIHSCQKPTGKILEINPRDAVALQTSANGRLLFNPLPCPANQPSRLPLSFRSCWRSPSRHF
jgi:hypothetical protein